MALGTAPTHHPSSSHVEVHALGLGLAQEVRSTVAPFCGQAPQIAFNIADAVVSDALGLPGKGEHHDRLERGFANLGLAEIEAMLPVLRSLLTLARGYAAYTDYLRR